MKQVTNRRSTGRIERESSHQGHDRPVRQSPRARPFRQLDESRRGRPGRRAREGRRPLGASLEASKPWRRAGHCRPEPSADHLARPRRSAIETKTPNPLTPEILTQIEDLADAIATKRFEELDRGIRRPAALTAVLTPAGKPGRGGPAEPRSEKAASFLSAWMSGDVAGMKALSEGDDASGGYLVPDELRQEITDRAQHLSRMASRVRRIACRTNTILVPTLATDVSVAWGSENAQFAESDPQFGQPSISMNRLNVLTKLSRELISDNAVDLVDYVSDLFAEAVAVEEDRVVALGSGSGQPEGLYSAAGLQEYAVSGPITYDSLLEIYYLLPDRYRARGVWLGADDTFKAIKQLEDTAGTFIWGPNAEGGVPAQLLGRPIVAQPAWPTGALMFGDPRYYHMYAREEFTVESSTSAGSAFAAHQLWLKGWERIDGKLILAEAWVRGTGIT